MDVLLKKARVINAEGADVTAHFIAGAEQTLFIARTLGIYRAVLKERSPSCGIRCNKKGDQIIAGIGVTAALLKQHGIQIISSEDINKCP